MSKSVRWAWLVSLVAFVGVALVLSFVLALTTDSRIFYERNFVWLFWVNVTVAAMLALVVLLAALRLVVRLRRGKFGSRLLFKLAGIFALVGVVPGVLIYTVSYQFVSRSIEAWFDAKVEGALDAGLNLGRSTLDALVVDLGNRTRAAADRMAETRLQPDTLQLERLREQLGAEQVALLNGSGQSLVAAGGTAGASIAPERPTAQQIRQARLLRAASQLEGLDDEPTPGAAPRARVRALALVPNNDITLAGEDRFLLVVQAVPTSLATNALAVQSAYREYQQRALSRDGLRKMYIGTLTLALILAVFGAVLLAGLLGTQLARPLLLLAEGVKQVAQGDLTAKPVSSASDELGGLTRSFADMTEQLGQAREQVQRGVAQLESARTHLQTILDSLTAGVVVFDRERRIESVNPGATRIMKLPLSAHVGQRLEQVPGLEAFAMSVWQRFELHRSSPEAGERDHWQDSFDLVPTVPERDTLTLLVRGAVLPNDARLMVFDDITDVVSAQRSAAWAEVARRLAHEIKNPLTPIQLSAERLQHKLESKLEGTDQAMLVRSVGTIVAQVQAMKQLVNEFRDYARLPAAKLGPLNINELVGEVLALYGAQAEQGRLTAHCASGLPAIIGDASQLRQVVHNLVQNALDAVDEAADGHVDVVTEAVRNDNGDVRAVRLKVLDNGPGFADKVLKRAFEPYVTTKSKGTGLGLAVVKKIADEHGARVRIGNRTDAVAGLSELAQSAGAQVSLSFSNLAAVPAAAATVVVAGSPPLAH
ncbi:MAG: ATP-binding protein [Aquincola tertiaricarbonis]|uniref:sensor histidine kinase n=1 Tax=Aquincola tertiaricarbonis TaxID=391953 RepID=UPI0006149CCA|nr:ATP-binding protein [Aquincola tertiaricarbonis]